MTDDIDGSEANETVTFGLDGSSFEIDLSEAHAEDLREVLAPFISVGRRQTRRSTARSPAPAKAKATGDVDSQAVRSWAEANGVAVNARGRLKAEVIDQYRAANN